MNIFLPVQDTVIELRSRRPEALLSRVVQGCVLAALTLILSLSAWPGRVAAQPAALPQPVGYVNDFANVLPEASRARIEALALRLNQVTRGDMVVVTLPDLGGRPVEETALRLGREWKVGANANIGDAARNAGVIILLVPKETSTDGRGHCRIEVGQGAEGFITDAIAGSLCRTQTERFRAQDYSGALEALAFAVADRYANAFGVTLDGQPRTQQRSRPESEGSPPSFALIVLVVVIILVLNSRGAGRRGCVGCIPIPVPGPSVFTGGSNWGGGGFGGGGGGGFGGFGGGGGFSGGGGGSDW